MLDRHWLGGAEARAALVTPQYDYLEVASAA